MNEILNFGNIKEEKEIGNVELIWITNNPDVSYFYRTVAQVHILYIY